MRTIPLILCLPLLAGTAFAGEANLVLENAHFRYTISPEARNVAFVDRATGTDHLRAPRPSPCALVRVGGQERPATSVTVNGQTAAICSDATFAATNFTLASGTNTFTAVAQDAYGRHDTNISVCDLPASVAFACDQNGNLRTNGTEVLEYDDENQLVTNCVAGSWKSEFVYDGFRRRRIERDYTWNGASWSMTNELRFIYDGNVIIQHRDANNLPTLTLTRGLDLSGTLQGAGGIGGLLALTQPSAHDPQHLYYHSDGNGNVTCLINANQLVVAKAAYDPYGGFLSLSGPKALANCYWFASKPIHWQSGKYDFLYRWYVPQVAGWLNRDPIGEEGGINLYQFVGNNPIGFIDPLGLQSVAPVQLELDLEIELAEPQPIRWGSGRMPDEELMRAETDLLRRGAPANMALRATPPEEQLQQTWLSKLFERLANAIKGDCPSKPGPKPGLEGAHNQTIKAIAEKLMDAGNEILRGGKQPGLKEAIIETPGGNKETRRPDILYRTPEGEVRGANVGRTKADGTPVAREVEALNDLNGPGKLPTEFFPYDR
jgi:RHS repeat-associated protein